MDCDNGIAQLTCLSEIKLKTPLILLRVKLHFNAKPRRRTKCSKHIRPLRVSHHVNSRVFERIPYLLK